MQNRSVHGIPKMYHDPLWTMVNNKMTIYDTDSEDDIKNKIGLKSCFIEEFYSKHYTPLSRQIDRPFPVRPVYYEFLGEFLTYSQISYKELFEIGLAPGQSLQWPCEQDTEMCSFLDNTDDTTFSKASEMIEFLLPDVFRDILHSDSDNRSNRVLSILFEKQNDPDQISCIKFFENTQYIWKDLRREDRSVMRIKLNDMPELSAAFGLSLHCIFDLTENDVVLAKKGRTEIAMQKYCLLCTEHKDLLLEAFRKGGNV